MRYCPLGSRGDSISIIGLGGHEYLANGRSRGFNEDKLAAVQPGYLGNGYGGEKRRALLKLAFETGINFFDVTIDPEKEALGRNLQEVPPPYPIYIQTRPEGMVYDYDPGNPRLADYQALRDEVARILGLLRRERIEFLNLAFEASALEKDPEYLDKISDNIARLKQEGLILFASCETGSGERTYLAQIQAGCFDSLALNLNFCHDAALSRVVPEAAKAGMAVVCREAFMKGALFSIGEEAGISDRTDLVCAALRWNLSRDGVSTTLVGAENVDHLRAHLSAAEKPKPEPADEQLLDRLRQTASYTVYKEQRKKRFLSE